MSFVWDGHYPRLLAMEAQKMSQSEIAAVFADESGEVVTRDMVRHALARAKESVKTLHDVPKPERIPYLTKYYDYIVGNIRPEPKNFDARYNLLKKKDAKVLTLADLHIPFHDEAKIQEACTMHGDADCLIIVADLIDAFEHSSFEKGMSVPFEFELDEALRMLEFFSESFGLVEILEANHEDRVRRQIERNLAPSLQFLASKSILEVLARPFPNVIIHNDLWFFQQGSVIYTHPSKASRVEMKVPVEVEAHLREWSEHYGLDEFDTVVVAHTHGQSVGYTAKTKIIEIACMSIPHSYAYSPKIPYKHPQRNGYATVNLTEGKAVWNGCREYSYPIEKRK